MCLFRILSTCIGYLYRLAAEVMGQLYSNSSKARKTTEPILSLTHRVQWYIQASSLFWYAAER